MRIAWRVTRLNFRAQLEYRTEFLLMIAIGAIWQVSVIVFATVLLTRFTGMGGWDEPGRAADPGDDGCSRTDCSCSSWAGCTDWPGTSRRA